MVDKNGRFFARQMSSAIERRVPGVLESERETKLKENH